MSAVHTAWLAGHSFTLPDQKITIVDPTHVYEPMRGTSASLAVFTDSSLETCIGWIDTRTLGFDTAKDWIAAQPEERQKEWAREFDEWKRWHGAE